jgi:hypothetical protein
VELRELQVCERRARGVSERHARAHRAGRVRCSRPQSGRAAGREHRSAGEHAQRLAALGVCHEADASPAIAPQRGGRRALEHEEVVVRGDQRGQVSGDAAARGAAAGVNDPARGVTALEAERERAVSAAVEVHPEPLELAHLVGGLLAQDARGALPGDPTAGRERVLEMALGGVVDGQGGRDSALGPVARRAGQRRARDQGHAGALPCGHQRGVQSRRAGPDDGDVDPQRLCKGSLGHGSRVP